MASSFSEGTDIAGALNRVMDLGAPAAGSTPQIPDAWGSGATQNLRIPGAVSTTDQKNAVPMDPGASPMRGPEMTGMHRKGG